METTVDQLISMGFDRRKALSVLSSVNGSLEQAIAILTTDPFPVGTICEVKRSGGQWVIGLVTERLDGRASVEFRDESGKLYLKTVPLKNLKECSASKEDITYEEGELVSLLQSKDWIPAQIAGKAGDKLIVQYNSGTAVEERLVRADSPYIRKKDFKPSPQRNLPIDLQVGSTVDVRDIAGRWCPAEIVKVSPSSHIRIHYQGFDRKWDENIEIPRDYDRIAPEGSFSALPRDERYFVGAKVSVMGDFRNHGKPRLTNAVVKEVDGGQILVSYQNYTRRFHKWYIASEEEAKLIDSSNPKPKPRNETLYEVSDFLEVSSPNCESWEVAEVIDISGKRIMVRTGSGKNRWFDVEKDSICLRALSRTDEQIAKEKAEHKFIEFINGLGFEVYSIERDGNCLYRAIALIVFGDEGNHGLVRKECFEYMNENREHFQKFINEDIDEYIANTSKPCVWGGEPEIFAMMELFNKRVEIYYQGFEQQPTIQMGEDYNEFSVMRLSYHGNSHYNAVIDPFNPPPLGDGSTDIEQIREKRLALEVKEKERISVVHQ